MTEKTAGQEQILNFRMTTEETARLDRIAGQCGLTRSQLLRNLVEVGMDEFELFQRIGITRTALTVRDVLGWMTDKVKSVAEDIDKGQSTKA